MPKLSVIVPVYNVEQYIHKCVDSILNQTFTDFELILVDDGSPDNCGKICAEYAKQDGRVKVIHKKNGGLSDARNVGLEEAVGEYISFIDSDDWVDRNVYSESLEYMQKKDLDIVCFDVTEVRVNKNLIRHKFDSDKVFAAKDALYKILVDEIDNSACNKIFKRIIWKDVRFPVGRRFEDVATTYKVFNNATKVGYMKKAYYCYLKREGSIIATSFDAQKKFECFMGYKERLEFAHNYCLEAVEKCKMYATKNAVATVNAQCAGAGSISVVDQEILNEFFGDLGEVKFLNGKNKILLWGAQNCSVINMIYGKLSLWSKKFK